ncbi:MAG: FHA domain-containing protein [Clostridiales bacterium]|nr:FHA domain-containing protein [Clostridiales bacterium]
MKKVILRRRIFDKERFLTYNIDNEASLDEELLDFIEEEEPKGIVSVIFEEGEEFDTFSYDVTDKIHLSELSTQEVGAEMVLRVLRSLLLALIDMTEYRIPLSYLILHRDYIYVDSDYKVEFICIPIEEMQEDVDINSFLRGYLANIRYDLSEDCGYVAKLLSYVNNTAMFNMRNMVTLVEELMDERGIEIPDESSAEIYVEYQEVTDEEEVEEEPVEQETASEAQEDIDEFEDVSGGTEEVSVEAEVSGEAEELAGEVVVSDEAEEQADEAEISNEKEEVSAEAAVSSEEEETSDKAAVSNESGKVSAKAAGHVNRVEDVIGAIEEILENEKETIDPREEAIKRLKNQSRKASQKESQEEPHKESVISDDESIKEFIDKLVEEESAEETPVEEKKEKPAKRSFFKTKEAKEQGVVIEDELDEFLAEKEREDQEANHEESNMKIKKNIKVSRASILKNTQEELKAEGEEVEETENEPEEVEDAVEGVEEEVVSTSILSQTLGGTGLLKNVPNVKINPYLIRTNTKERIVITKQNFKIGKASMGVDYSVKGNGAVSRSHATITNKNGVYYIKDNKSTNHTYVNNKMLADGESELLTHDCKIVLGDEEFTFKLR